VFERFTNRAKRVITLAQDEAIADDHGFIGTEHVLLGLVKVPESVASALLTEIGITPDQATEETARVQAAAGIGGNADQTAKDALASIGIDVEQIRRRADETFGAGQFKYPRPPFSPRAKKVLELSMRESLALGHNYVGTEHLLLGLLAEGDGAAITVLTNLGVDVAGLRPVVLARMDPRV
jgi:ATP-dependent Clp protease ATP-binding subunit ClpC